MTVSKIKIIAVTGATGAQGGGVVNIMKKTAGWKVRAITRNTDSDAAKKLAQEENVEVVKADFDDETSLRAAFEGVSAIFAVTNWWEALFQQKTQHEAGEIEERHGMNLARAAASIPTLEHYLWSTQPSSKLRLTEEQRKGRFEVPHMDYKAKVDERIRQELPDLAAKTTYLYFGYYPQNMAFFPLLKPFELPGAYGQHVQLIASSPEAKILLAGDLSVNPGIWVRQILKTGKPAMGKYTNVALERWSFAQMAEKWTEITGKRCVVMQVSEEDWTNIWGPAGRELSWQFKFGEMVDPWGLDGREGEFVSWKELGIEEGEVVGFEGTIRGLQKAGFF
ncbi:hypothetical protein V8F33_011418 [Rhypophila sp. PSN 637]